MKRRGKKSGRNVATTKSVGSEIERPEASQSRWQMWYEERGPIFKFGLKFAALMGLFYAAVLMPFFNRLLYAYLSANAWLASGVLNWFGQQSHVSEITIRSAQFAITVRRGCDAIEPAWFFCAALLAFPAPLKRKIIGLVTGSLLLQVLNLVRIVSLYFIGIHYPARFSLAHLEIWPAIFILVAIVFWILWIGWARRSSGPLSHAAA